jgi:hypothetical protein
LVEFLRTTQVPTTPFQNQFFHSKTDEFIFMDIIQRQANDK